MGCSSDQAWVSHLQQATGPQADTDAVAGAMALLQQLLHPATEQRHQLLVPVAQDSTDPQQQGHFRGPEVCMVMMQLLQQVNLYCWHQLLQQLLLQ